MLYTQGFFQFPDVLDYKQFEDREEWFGTPAAMVTTVNEDGFTLIQKDILFFTTDLGDIHGLVGVSKGGPIQQGEVDSLRKDILSDLEGCEEQIGNIHKYREEFRKEFHPHTGYPHLVDWRTGDDVPFRVVDGFLAYSGVENVISELPQATDLNIEGIFDAYDRHLGLSQDEVRSKLSHLKELAKNVQTELAKAKGGLPDYNIPFVTGSTLEEAMRRLWEMHHDETYIEFMQLYSDIGYEVDHIIEEARGVIPFG